MRHRTSAAPRQILVGPLPAPSQVGDAAIAVGAVVLLREAFPSATIAGWSAHVDSDNETSVQSFIDTYGVDSVVYSPVSFDAATRHGPVADVTGAVTKYALPPLGRVMRGGVLRMPMGAMQEITRAIAEADLVIMRGGGYLSSPNVLCDLWGLRLNSLSEIAIARSLGVPYAIWGHTIWGLDGPLTRRILWPLIRDSAVTVCREQRSFDYLSSTGAPTSRLAVLPDTAFAVTPAPAETIERILAREGLQDVARPLFGANVSPIWTNECAQHLSVSAYVAAFAKALQHVAKSLQAHPVLVLHGYSTDAHTLPECQDDSAIALRVARAMDAPCTIVSGQYTPSERVGLYARFEAMVTTRLHAGILSVAAGTPTAFIAYEKNKTRGTATLLGLEKWVTDIETITGDALPEALDDLWASRGEVRAELGARLEDIRDRLAGYARLTLEGLDDGSPGAEE